MGPSAAWRAPWRSPSTGLSSPPSAPQAPHRQPWRAWSQSSPCRARLPRSDAPQFSINGNINFIAKIWYHAKNEKSKTPQTFSHSSAWAHLSPAGSTSLVSFLEAPGIRKCCQSIIIWVKYSHTYILINLLLQADDRLFHALNFLLACSWNGNMIFCI